MCEILNISIWQDDFRKIFIFRFLSDILSFISKQNSKRSRPQESASAVWNMVWLVPRSTGLQYKCVGFCTRVLKYLWLSKNLAKFGRGDSLSLKRKELHEHETLMRRTACAIRIHCQSRIRMNTYEFASKSFVDSVGESGESSAKVYPSAWLFHF